VFIRRRTARRTRRSLKTETTRLLVAERSMRSFAPFARAHRSRLSPSKVDYPRWLPSTGSGLLRHRRRS
jgi:hypothetical protein